MHMIGKPLYSDIQWLEILERCDTLGYKNINQSLYKFNQNLKFNNLFFQLDYEKMKKENKKFAEELAMYVFHPQRIMRLSIFYCVDFSDYLDFIS